MGSGQSLCLFAVKKIISATLSGHVIIATPQDSAWPSLPELQHRICHALPRPPSAHGSCAVWPLPGGPRPGRGKCGSRDHLSQTLSLDKHLWLLLISSSVSTAMMRMSPHCPQLWPLLHRAEARAGSVQFLASPAVRYGHGEGRAGENWSPHLMTCLGWGRWAGQQAGHGGECWEPSPRPGGSDRGHLPGHSGGRLGSLLLVRLQ